jgi:hypothetical protein
VLCTIADATAGCCQITTSEAPNSMSLILNRKFRLLKFATSQRF